MSDGGKLARQYGYARPDAAGDARSDAAGEVCPHAVRDASARLAGVAHRTPILRSRTLDRMVGAHVVLKVESLQRTGTFKFRGAYNALVQLPRERLRRGVVAYSSGNHAVAVALAARLLRAPATLVLPRNVVAAKLAAVRAYGGEVVWYNPAQDDREALAARIAAERGAEMIPSFDMPAVIAGQGTVGLELLEDEPEAETIVIPAGGGGLLGGCAALRAPGVRLIGVEASGLDRIAQSLRRGELVTVPPADTIADGLRVRRAGVHTFALISANVHAMAVADDREIVAAMRFLFERMKLVAEPSGAIALAALIAGRVPVDSRVAVVISGGNVDAAGFAHLVTRVP